MKVLLAAVLFILISSHVANSQSLNERYRLQLSGEPSFGARLEDALFKQPEPEATVGKKLGYTAGAVVLFAAYDYVGFNLAKHDENWLEVYRVSQVVLQGALAWVLNREAGWSSAAAFGAIWWTFGCDLLYYAFAELLDPGEPWQGAGAFSESVLADRVTWAYWTPLGIARGYDREEPIEGSALLTQAAIGLVAGVTLTVAF
ncbi:MAG: hypothetical protein CL946_03460 [Ectothiorhodospiraceae bacterium]|nr:hypothetical protein [Ectothiorhodospiraceae bacterium]